MNIIFIFFILKSLKISMEDTSRKIIVKYQIEIKKAKNKNNGEVETFYRQKTVLRSFYLSSLSIIISLFGLAFILILSYFYTEPLWNWSISPNGIPNL